MRWGDPHSFHIPVMGTGYTIDSPLAVARYGISSVISLVDDHLIEQMRRLHAERAGEPYEEIHRDAEDSRARRITAYLDLLGRLVARQLEALRESPFEPGSELARYFELLPDGPLRERYRELLALPRGPARQPLEAELRQAVRPGSIDVNIMTKLDRGVGPKGEAFGPESSDALAAARGYALSGLRHSSLVLSAGMNPRLFGYLGRLDAFRPDENGQFAKGITLKVSDFRSALVQGRMLAKKGVWVSEYRIESGLNCGGHAFATKGLLLGPILAEFAAGRDALVGELRETWSAAVADEGPPAPAEALDARVTVQGGIGTAAEHAFMREQYGVDSVGWGTPFLLVPEVTNVDEAHLEKLAAATGDDVYLSEASPLQIPFWNLRESSSEQARRARIERGRPGSACPNGYAVTSTEFGEVPQCLASRAYQKEKLRLLDLEDPSGSLETVLARSCICHDLAGGATVKHGIDPDATPAICPGPGIQDFSRVASLDEMVDHIYGRGALVTNPLRPHAFIRELGLYVEHFAHESAELRAGTSSRKPRYLDEFRENLRAGIDYYRELSGRLPDGEAAAFRAELEKLAAEVDAIGTP